MTKAPKLAAFLFVAAAVFFFALRARSYTRTMMVISPEQWTAGQSCNCVATGVDPVSNLPQLNCDMASDGGVRSQAFVQDVRFSRRNKKRPITYWTCQEAGKSLACRN